MTRFSSQKQCWGYLRGQTSPDPNPPRKKESTTRGWPVPSAHDYSPSPLNSTRPETRPLVPPLCCLPLLPLTQRRFVSFEYPTLFLAHTCPRPGVLWQSCICITAGGLRFLCPALRLHSFFRYPDTSGRSHVRASSAYIIPSPPDNCTRWTAVLAEPQSLNAFAFLAERKPVPVMPS